MSLATVLGSRKGSLLSAIFHPVSVAFGKCRSLFWFETKTPRLCQRSAKLTARMFAFWAKTTGG